jgi:hypothetical protein
MRLPIVFGHVLLIALVLSPAIAISVAYGINEYRRHRFAAQLFDMPLPPDARVLAKSSRVGADVGFSNSDHCSFEAVLVLETSFTAELAREFEQFLSHMALEPAHPDGLRKPRLVVSSRSPYTILLRDGPYDPNLDFRCW